MATWDGANSISRAHLFQQSFESRSYHEIRVDGIAIDDRFISSYAPRANLYFSLFFPELRERLEPPVAQLRELHQFKMEKSRKGVKRVLKTRCFLQDPLSQGVDF
jgi:hypothetical protein